MTKKFPKNVDELPNEPFFAILKSSSYNVAADDYWSIEIFADKEEWKKEIEILSKATGFAKQSFKALLIKPAKITTNISIDI